MNLEIQPATPADRDAVVATVVAAFVADPAFRYFFPDDATYERHAGVFAGYLFDKRVRQGTVWLGGDAAAVALWDPPRPAQDDSWQSVDLPVDVRERIDQYDEAVHPLLPTEPFWYLGVLARHPSHAGRGFGRLLMEAGVTAAHAEGLPAYLETTNPSNVDLYLRAGWEIVGDLRWGDVPTWVLTNRPLRTDSEDAPALAAAK